MQALVAKPKRVIVVHWKDRPESPFEVFSNLKNFCLSYLQFNYHTLNNYLSKGKIPYENEQVRIERQIILTEAITPAQPWKRKIVPMVRRVRMDIANDEQHDLEYWQTKSVKERAEAVTLIIAQSLRKGQRMDKSKVSKNRVNHDTGRGF